ncbi:MBL fold metallo-hydrolase [Candidatus Woesearchaeota archaeon]|nr:MBL fold metallo-hydrolase [Candidatus Woesearchaeota archaeon]
MEQLAPDVWKLNVDSNVYFLDIEPKTLIDVGPEEYKELVKSELSKVVRLEDIGRIIFTHFHLDHIGNFDLFPNAKFYAAKEEIDFFRKNPEGAVLDRGLAKKFSQVALHPLTALEGFDIIRTPGHARGAICLLYKKRGILFSGDTLFNNGIGRLDLPSSEPEKMQASLEKIKKLDYKILAPGHDY